MAKSTITWNSAVRLILADVDQTVADDFMPAEPALNEQLERLLREDISIFFVTGSPLARLQPRVIDHIDPKLRHKILVAHCSGAEVWGFDKDGELHNEPFYGLYDQLMTEGQKRAWRKIVDELIGEFKLEIHPPQNVEQFRSKYGGNPFAIMFEDRGPQITFEMLNAYELNSVQRLQIRAKLPHLKETVDLREPIANRFTEEFQAKGVPITPRLAGVFALDMALQGVSKAEAVKTALASKHILEHIGLGQVDLNDPQTIEIWGDRFDRNRGTDWLMCAAVNPAVRAINFRDEDPRNFPAGLNITLWNGKYRLHEGVLEYLRSH